MTVNPARREDRGAVSPALDKFWSIEPNPELARLRRGYPRTFPQNLWKTQAQARLIQRRPSRSSSSSASFGPQEPEA